MSLANKRGMHESESRLEIGAENKLSTNVNVIKVAKP